MLNNHRFKNWKRFTKSHAGILAICFSVILVFSVNAAPNLTFKEQRKLMVAEYIIKEGIKNQKVIEAIGNVKRHEFVPRGQKNNSYQDNALPIGYKQTISPPFIVAYMTEVLDPKPTDKVLEIGTGSGYQAAVLAEIVKQVYSIEIVEQLGNRAKSTLRRLDYKNVETKVGDGYKGWPEKAPFDKIIVTCSPEEVPKPLVNQLKEGGKMIIPLGQRYQQLFILLEKKNGVMVQTKLVPTLFVPMTGQSERERIVKPQPANPEIQNGGFEEEVGENGFVNGWHYQRRSELINEDAPEGKKYLEFDNDVPGRPAHILQGMAIDGRKIKAIRITLKVKGNEIQFGPKSFEKPGIVIHFYNKIRNPIHYKASPGWRVFEDGWETKVFTMLVPPDTRESIIQIGLNGASGKLAIDDVKLMKQYR